MCLQATPTSQAASREGRRSTCASCGVRPFPCAQPRMLVVIRQHSRMISFMMPPCKAVSFGGIYGLMLAQSTQ